MVNSSRRDARVENVFTSPSYSFSPQATNTLNSYSVAVSKLCVGMKIDDAINKLSGIDCRGRGTSCPDQLAKALKEVK